MKRVFVREVGDGVFSLENFGMYCAGRDGSQPFRLVVESKKRDLIMEFPETYLFDLFTTFDLQNPDFLANRFMRKNFLRMKVEGEECVIEAGSGTLYDFFKERAASGECSLHGPRPLAFYWTGNSDHEAA